MGPGAAFSFSLSARRVGEVRDEMPEKDRDMAYFHAVLDHIAALTLRHPHQEDERVN